MSHSAVTEKASPVLPSTENPGDPSTPESVPLFLLTSWESAPGPHTCRSSCLPLNYILSPIPLPLPWYHLSPHTACLPSPVLSPSLVSPFRLPYVSYKNDSVTRVLSMALRLRIMCMLSRIQLADLYGEAALNHRLVSAKERRKK